ncbi:hypothetical protein B194_2620 [Serratia plymuthica A30]|nr:hypothetical protein B194_2620 [Serratia plymuthica A30]
MAHIIAASSITVFLFSWKPIFHTMSKHLKTRQKYVMAIQ